MLEAELQRNVIDLATMMGLETQHQTIALRSKPGWPDLVIVGNGHALFRELKVGKNKLTEHQTYWITILREAGLDAAEWRDTDWESGRILDELRQLRRLRVPRPAVKMPRSTPVQTPRSGYRDPFGTSRTK